MQPVENSTALIIEQLRAARQHYRQILAEMDRLEAAGMYPAVPSENWQARNGGAAIYLYMVFQRDRQTGRYQGPDGKRKVYVGAAPGEQRKARQLAINRQQWERLDRAAGRLRLWFNEFVAGLNMRADQATRYPKAEGLGQPGAAGQPPASPNEPEPLEMLRVPPSKAPTPTPTQESEPNPAEQLKRCERCATITVWKNERCTRCRSSDFDNEALQFGGRIVGHGE